MLMVEAPAATSPLHPYFWENRARADLVKHLAKVPDPGWFALGLDMAAAAAMLRCWTQQGLPRAATREDAAILRPLGLCDYASLFLTAFGGAVLAEMNGGRG